MQAKAKKLIFIAVLLAGCIITGLISTNNEAKTLPGSSLRKVLSHPKQRRQKVCVCR